MPRRRRLERLTLGLLFIVAALFFAADTAHAQVNVLTQHYDNARTGQNTNETVLNTANVNVDRFGKVFTRHVKGQVYAQPLYVQNVKINGLSHNVLIVATEQDMVYAFDADSDTGLNANPLWVASMVDAAHGAPGETPLNLLATPSKISGCADLQPYVGITSTPVIDPVTQTIYVEAKSVNRNGRYFHRLHALSLLTGAERQGGPVRISARVKVAGHSIYFQSLYQMNRPGLLLQNGMVYLAFASHCDIEPFHGWLFAYDAKSLVQKSKLVITPKGGLGGFWMAGAGVASDSQGNIFIASGNGAFNPTNSANADLGDTLMKVGVSKRGELTLVDYFTPSDQQCLEKTDIDLGSGGVVLLPDQPGEHPHILVQAGKEGMVYVINRDQMTKDDSHYIHDDACTSKDPQILEEAPVVKGLWSTPAYWNNNIYFWGVSDVLKVIPVTNGLPDFAHPMTSSVTIGYPGATPVISSNGTAPGTGIVWAIDTSPSNAGLSVVHALDATTAKELWNSGQAATRDQAGGVVKFAVPTVANGKVYVGTANEVDVYGLLPGAGQQTAGDMPEGVTGDPADPSQAPPVDPADIDFFY